MQRGTLQSLIDTTSSTRRKVDGSQGKDKESRGGEGGGASDHFGGVTSPSQYRSRSDDKGQAVEQKASYEETDETGSHCVHGRVGRRMTCWTFVIRSWNGVDER